MPSPEESHPLRHSRSRKFFRVSAHILLVANTSTQPLLLGTLPTPWRASAASKSGLWACPCVRAKGLCLGAHSLFLRRHSSTSSEETQLFHIPRVTSLRL